MGREAEEVFWRPLAVGWEEDGEEEVDRRMTAGVKLD